MRNNANKPKRNTFVKYKLANYDWQKGKVLSVQPKQTGQYKNWINVHLEGDEVPICVNWDDVES